MRKGHALQSLKRYEEAKIAFEEGLDLDPENTAIQQGIKECKAKLTGEYTQDFCVVLIISA